MPIIIDHYSETITLTSSISGGRMLSLNHSGGTNPNAAIEINSPTGYNSNVVFRENSTDKFLFGYNAAQTGSNRSADTFEIYSFASSSCIFRIHESSSIALSIDSSSNTTVHNDLFILGALASGVVSAGSQSTSYTVNPSLGNTFDITFTGNVTITMTNGTSSLNGQMLKLRIKQDGNGNRTIAWAGSNVRFGTDITSITLTTTAGKTDYIGLVWNHADTKWDVVSYVKGF